jgi:hypothetical protein
MATRKAIPAETKLRLFAASAGHCQNPGCLAPLFPPELNGVKHIAEMAHVIPHGEKGPRSEERPSEEFESDSFENLILLCPTCHTVIDKNPEAYPRTMLLSWKENHVPSLTLAQGIKAYQNRHEARAAITEHLQENKAIWERLAPVDGSEFEYNPESEGAQLWTQRMKSIILPNHYRTLSVLKANVHLMTGEEQEIYAEYKEHVRGLADRHISGIAGRAIRFPEKMERIFECIGK